MTAIAGTASISDAQAPDVWAHLHAACFDRPWSEREITGLAGLPGTIGLTGLLENRPAGFLLARQAADEAEVLTICVLPEARRMGIARQLMEHLIIRLADAETLFLEVDARNEAAVQLYQSIGFAQAGERKGYYLQPDGNKADALVLRRDLSGKV